MIPIVKLKLSLLINAQDAILHSQKTLVCHRNPVIRHLGNQLSMKFESSD